MQTFKERKTVYFDVDDTLMEWYPCEQHVQDAVYFNNNGHEFYKRAIMPNIKALMAHHRAGHLVVVWSAGGSGHAENVIKTLNLTDYVDVILTKPDYYYDDKPASEWMPEDCQFKTE